MIRAKPSASLIDHEAMALAVSHAWGGWGKAKPNPMVGCVAVDQNNAVVSVGHHELYGQAHAERNTLLNIYPELVRDGTLYVSLEPCSHHGKTPPCAELVAQFPFKRVVIGAKDPNPLVAGRGIEYLEKRGIKVDIYTGPVEKEIRYLNEIFFHNMQAGTSFWAAKLASSVDGLIALSSGDSKWITGEAAREQVHYLRAGFSAIAVGSKTLKIDNPQLNIRHNLFPDHRNKVLVFDSNCEFIDDDDLNIKRVHPLEDLLWIAQGRHLHKRTHTNGVNIIEVDWTNHDAFHELAQFLYEKEDIQSVFVEGGAMLISALIQTSLLKRFYHFQAPILLGRSGIGMTESLHLQSMAARKELELISRDEFGKDLLSVYRF